MIDAFCRHLHHLVDGPDGARTGIYIKPYPSQHWHQGSPQTSETRREAGNLAFSKPGYRPVSSPISRQGAREQYELIVPQKEPGACLLADY